MILKRIVEQIAKKPIFKNLGENVLWEIANMDSPERNQVKPANFPFQKGWPLHMRQKRIDVAYFDVGMKSSTLTFMQTNFVMKLPYRYKTY